MIIKENINFERGEDPKKTLRIGTSHLITRIMEKFEESSFELTKRDMVLDLTLEYELSPEDFHNPANYPQYDWDFAGGIQDFLINIIYMIDLNRGEIFRHIKISNPQIDKEYVDNIDWKITSLNAEKIYKEIDQDYVLFDIADAAEYLWEVYENQQEEDFDGEIDESLDFERGQNPMDSMELGRIEDRREKIINWIVDHDPNNWTGSSLLSSFITRRLPHPLGWNMSSFEEVSIQELNQIKSYMEKWDKIDKNSFYWSASKVQEKLEFERGMDPKKSMEIGIKGKILRGLNSLFGNSGRRWGISTINLIENRNDLWLEIRDYGTPNFVDNFFSLLDKNFFKDYYLKAKPKKYKNSFGDDWVFMIKPEYKDFFRDCFDSDGYLSKKIDESINFERGIDPKQSMKIGGIRPVNDLRRDYERILNLVHTKKYSIFQNSFSQEVLDLGIINPKHFGWGNIQNNFLNMNREELYPFEILVQKYTKLLGLDEPQR